MKKRADRYLYGYTAYKSFAWGKHNYGAGFLTFRQALNGVGELNLCKSDGVIYELVEVKRIKGGKP